MSSAIVYIKYFCEWLNALPTHLLITITFRNWGRFWIFVQLSKWEQHGQEERNDQVAELFHNQRNASDLAYIPLFIAGS